MNVKIHNDINEIFNSIERTFNTFTGLIPLFSTNNEDELFDILSKRAEKLLCWNEKIRDFKKLIINANKIDSVDIAREINDETKIIELTIRFDPNKPVIMLPNNYIVSGILNSSLLINGIFVNVNTIDLAKSSIRYKISELITDKLLFSEYKINIWYTLEYKQDIIRYSRTKTFSFDLQTKRDNKYTYFYIDEDNLTYKFNIELEPDSEIVEEKFEYLLYLLTEQARGVNTGNNILTTVNLFTYETAIELFVDELLKDYYDEIEVKQEFTNITGIPQYRIKLQYSNNNFDFVAYINIISVITVV